MAEEYITLTSDASLDIFPDNTIGKFRVKLPKKLYLDRTRHQIGMKLISYPHKISNINDGKFTVFIHKTNADPNWPIHFDAEIPNGYYKTPNSLKNALNRSIRNIPNQFQERYVQVKQVGISLKNDLFFTYHTNCEKITLDYRTAEIGYDLEEYHFFVWLSDELLMKIGHFLPKDLLNQSISYMIPATADNDTYNSQNRIPHTVDLNLGQNAIFVYSDIIENDRVLGSTLSPLLSMVPFEGEHGTQVHFEPKHIEYCAPRYNVVDEVGIQLLTDTGEKVKFNSGKVYVTLHIKDRFA